MGGVVVNLVILTFWIIMLMILVMSIDSDLRVLKWNKARKEYLMEKNANKVASSAVQGRD